MSPCIHEFDGYTFAYGDHEDLLDKTPYAIPDCVGIIMSHGPPSFSNNHRRLDLTKGDDRVGCSKLGQTIERGRSGLHCFGCRWNAQDEDPTLQAVELDFSLLVWMPDSAQRETLLLKRTAKVLTWRLI